MFFGAQQHKYGHEVLVRWCLHTRAAEGGAVSRDMAVFKNSTHEHEEPFVRVAFCIAYMERARGRAVIEVPLGERQDGKHGHKSTIADIFSLTSSAKTVLARLLPNSSSLWMLSGPVRVS